MTGRVEYCREDYEKDNEEDTRELMRIII